MERECKKIVSAAFQALDRVDAKAFLDMLADDISQVDEVTQRWVRGKSNVVAAVAPLFSIIQSMKSDLSDFHVTRSNDIAVVTCMLNQTYVIASKSTTIVAPTTCVLRQESGTWKFVLLHTIPLSSF